MLLIRIGVAKGRPRVALGLIVVREDIDESKISGICCAEWQVLGSVI